MSISDIRRYDSGAYLGFAHVPPPNEIYIAHRWIGRKKINKFPADTEVLKSNLKLQEKIEQKYIFFCSYPFSLVNIIQSFQESSFVQFPF